MPININILLIIALIIFIVPIGSFLAIALFRNLGKGQSAKVDRLIKRHAGLADLLVEPGDHTDDALVERLKRIGEQKYIEMFLDAVVSGKGLKTSHLQKYYDAVGITKRYFETLENSTSWKKRAFAAEKLGRIASAKSVPLLISVIRNIKDEDEDVRGVALRALGRIKNESAIPFLIEALGFPETWLSPRIGEILIDIGKASIPQLVKELRNIHSESRRIWAAKILGEFSEKNTLIPLMDALSDISPEVRANAAGALGQLKEERALDKLFELLISDPVPFVRVRASQALGSIGHPSVIDYLINMLKDPEWWVRVRAIEALEQMDKKAVPALLISLEDEDQDVRRRAAMALERNGYLEKILNEYGSSKYNPDLRKILFLIVKAGVIESICEKLENSEIYQQKNIVRILGEAEIKEASEPLINLLKNTADWSLEARIIQSLGKIRAIKATPHLIACLRSPEYWVRKSAVEALVRLDAKDSADNIADILDDPSPQAREAALNALARLGLDGYKKRIKNLLFDPSPKVSAAAVRVMRDLNFSINKNEIVRIVKNPSEDVRKEVVRYAAAAREASVAFEIVKLLPVASDALKTEIYDYLRKTKRIKFKKVLKTLQARELSNELLVSLIEVGSIINDKHAKNYVAEFTKNQDPALRIAAYDGLRKIGLQGYEAALEAGLSDPSAKVRVNVIAAIALGSDIKTFKKAASLLEDPEEDVRMALALAFGASGHAQYKNILNKMLNDFSTRVIAGVLLSLSSFNDPVPIETMYQSKRIREIREEIRKIRKNSLYQNLVERIKERTSSSDKIELEILFAEDEKKFTQDLISKLNGTLDPEHRARSMDILKILAPQEIFIPMLKILKKDPSQDVRIKAMEILVSMDRDIEVVEALASMLFDPSLNVRIKAAALLGQYKNQRAFEALLYALNTSDRQFREIVTTSLSKILIAEPERVGNLLKEIPETKTTKLGMAWLMGKTRKPGALKYLRKLLIDSDADVRAAAIGALAKFKQKQLLQDFEKVIYDPNERVRAAAVNALSLIGGQRAFEIIEAALEDIDEFVRVRVAIGLAKVDLSDAITVLRTKARRFPEIASCLNAIQFVVDLSLEPFIRNDRLAQNVIKELCPEEAMLTDLKSSSIESKRLRAIKVLATVHNYNILNLRDIVRKDPSVEVRDEAEKFMAS